MRRLWVFLSITVLLAAMGSYAVLMLGDSQESTQVASVEDTETVSNETPVDEPQFHPFAGRDADPNSPVLILKIDNSPDARPHTGLQAADLVYVEEIEGGYNRFVAVYSSNFPREVGPVRSARISDLDLIAQFGRPAFGYSGAQSRLIPELQSGDFIDVSGLTGPAGWVRDPNRVGPYDFMARPAGLLERAADIGEVSTAKEIGLTFNNESMVGGWGVTDVEVKYPATRIGFEWDSFEKGWVVLLDGETDVDTYTKKPVMASSVVIPIVQQSSSNFTDKWGGVTPKQETIGEGAALVLKDGEAMWARWSRPTAQDGIRVTKDGQDVALAPGQIWFVLTDRATKVLANPPHAGATPVAKQQERQTS
jgi:hypothetical protein